MCLHVQPNPYRGQGCLGKELRLVRPQWVVLGYEIGAEDLVSLALHVHQAVALAFRGNSLQPRQTPGGCELYCVEGDVGILSRSLSHTLLP